MSIEERLLVGISGSGGQAIYDDGYLRIEHDNYYVACDRKRIYLARKEFLILSRLVLSAERVVTSEQIWRYAWGTETTFNSRSLRVHIYRLRRMLESHGIEIDSMVGVGYQLSIKRTPASASS
jgi:DNA-binding response OmpR family regulator